MKVFKFLFDTAYFKFHNYYSSLLVFSNDTKQFFESLSIALPFSNRVFDYLTLIILNFRTKYKVKVLT